MAVASAILPEPIVSPGNDKEPEIIVRPMLTTAQKNFKDVRHCDSVLSCKIPENTSRQDLNVPGSRCFLLHDLLTEEECRHYIKETERIGYSDLSDVFPADYRSNDRVLAICEPLTECLWKRVEPFLTRREVIRVRPMGFGNDGTWKPFRLNECCKFGRYKPGGHFSPHIDGPWVPHEDESSVFTVVIYLNSDFEGGTTNFLDENDIGDVVCSVLPKTGTALIFNHDTLHEGQPVTKATKYIIRTEVMFRRVDSEMIPTPLAYEEDEKYIRTLALYRKAWQLEQAGDSKGFTDTYLEAIKLQRQAQNSIATDANELFEQLVPYEVYMKIFGYLSAKELSSIMTVCKAWYDMAMDGKLWYDLYRGHWPLGIKLEAQLDHTRKTLKQEPGPFIKDWYGLYKQRVIMDAPKKVVVIDLGSFSCKCAALHRKNCTVKTSCTESVVAVAPGVFDLHIRRREYDRYYCGRQAKEKYPGFIQNIVKNGVPMHSVLLPEIVTGFYYDCLVRPKYAPVVVLEPPGLWDAKVRGEVAHTFVRMFAQPSVSFLSSAVAVLCGMDLTSGVVVDVGHGIATCAAVWRGEECPAPTSCDPAEASPTQLAYMVHTVITGVSGAAADMAKSLKESVVLTGGKSDKSGELQRELRKKDPNYTVIEPSDKVFAAVNGGCTLAALSTFEVFQDTKSFHLEKNKKYKAHPFYKFCVAPGYWLFGLSDKTELEEYWGHRFPVPESGFPDSPVFGRKYLSGNELGGSGETDGKEGQSLKKKEEERESTDSSSLEQEESGPVDEPRRAPPAPEENQPQDPYCPDLPPDDNTRPSGPVDEPRRAPPAPEENQPQDPYCPDLPPDDNTRPSTQQTPVTDTPQEPRQVDLHTLGQLSPGDGGQERRSSADVNCVANAEGQDTYAARGGKRERRRKSRMCVLL